MPRFSFRCFIPQSCEKASFLCIATLINTLTHSLTHPLAEPSYKGERGISERSPSQWVFQDYLDVMNKIANSIEAFRTNENYQCVTQLHFSFVCLSLEQNRFYK